MFCPSCRDEFRPGFTRCGNCDEDLVEELAPSAGDVPSAPERSARTSPARLLDYCGFFSLDEAQLARQELRAEGIRCEVVIREAADAVLDAPPVDEFWLRVDVERLQDAAALLEPGAASFEAAEPDPTEANPHDDGDFECSACGELVAASARACPHCSAKFDDE